MKNFLIICLFMVSILSYAQNLKTTSSSFLIEDSKNPDKTSFFTSSIQNANFEQYRLVDEDLELLFNNGFTLKLFSVKNCFLKGIVLDPSKYKSKRTDGYTYPVFTILDSGNILAEVKIKQKQKTEK